MYKISKKNAIKWLKFLLLLVLGIALNLLGNAFANHCLGKLLYLDTIGTMVVAVMGGYFPGIFVALITNVITFIEIPPSVYYVFLNIFIAISTTYFYKKFYYKTRSFRVAYIQYIMLIAFSSSLFATLITFGQGESAPHADGLIDSIVIFFMQNLNLNFYIAHFISNMIINLFDKNICALISFAIFKGTPKKLREEIHDVGWLQKPLTDVQLQKIGKASIRKMSVKTKIIIALSMSCLAVTLVISIMSRMLFINFMEQKYSDEAKGVSRLAASSIEADRVNDYIKLGENAVGYNKTEELLYNVSLVTSNVQYIFVYRVSEDGYTVVFDLDTDELKGEDPGTHVDFDPSVYPYIEKLKAGEEIEPFITDDEKIGYYLTSFSPVYDDNGECICYAGVDISMKDFKEYEKQFIFRLLSLCMGFMVMIIAAGMWFSKYHMIYPINTLVRTTEKFEYDDEESRKHNVESIRELGIHTGDEIENLYYAFLQTMEENMINYTYMQQKSKDLDSVQTKLIMVLADLVENRDASTGDHIKKTSKYTEIVMHKMIEMGYYTDKLTEDFVQSVVKAAPLHDIGKIRVSDAILNKPGKLTDDEFEIMKMHTVYGAEVIDQCISSMASKEYLNEAKNIAAYHHEKWNGKGYPEGLSGEDIPLSARIMAVADVFDALVSKRVYKDAFSFEDAMDIIRKDSGTHFDPKVAEAFIAAADEVREAADYFDIKRIESILNG
ncbi:MAG: HD domain-containing protein [Lachnospiraceae bacterium]|nr:HD domain-containing protein [Lachnospiraceae bacterium]